MSFLNPEPVQAPKKAFVHPVRKDGKRPVTFVFPISGARIKKLIPAAELEKATAGFIVVYVG